jgi:hypothetical protein
MVDIFSTVYEYGTLKPVEVVLRMKRGKKENNRGKETKLGHIVCTYGNVTMKPSI